MFGWFAIFIIRYLSEMLICPFGFFTDRKINFRFLNVLSTVSSHSLARLAASLSGGTLAGRGVRGGGSSGRVLRVCTSF